MLAFHACEILMLSNQACFTHIHLALKVFEGLVVAMIQDKRIKLRQNMSILIT